MPDEKILSADEVTKKARTIWQKYLSLTEELLKFINKNDIEMFMELIPQRAQLIEMDNALPSHEYRKLDEFKEIAEQIKPLDKEVMYKARAWLNKSRRQNSAVRSYDVGSSMFGRGIAFNRQY